MKYFAITLMLMLSIGTYAQKTVYNVQHYCVDEYPLKAGSCDVSGTEYSFVFTDTKNKEVTLFLADNKMKYKIVKVNAPAKNGSTTYLLENEAGKAQMQISPGTNRIIFDFPQRQITLKTGKSTRAD